VPGGKEVRFGSFPPSPRSHTTGYWSLCGSQFTGDEVLLLLQSVQLMSIYRR
jgi:hypothetical protein